MNPPSFSRKSKKSHPTLSSPKSWDSEIKFVIGNPSKKKIAGKKPYRIKKTVCRKQHPETFSMTGLRNCLWLSSGWTWGPPLPPTLVHLQKGSVMTEFHTLLGPQEGSSMSCLFSSLLGTIAALIFLHWNMLSNRQKWAIKYNYLEL